MSVVTTVRNYVEGSEVRTGCLRVVFGDTRGLAVFLGSLCFFTLYWRIGVFITDTNVFLNTLVNVADGHLYVESAPYGRGKLAPGTYVSDGRAYGRNYGVIFAALPVYLGIRGVATVLDPGVLVVSVWPLCLLGLAMVLGNLFDRPRLTMGGSCLALALFLGNVAVAQPLGPKHYPVIALQIVTLLATAFSCVLIYRLLANLHSPRTGVLAAAAAFLGTPLAFWAAFPKRHSFTVLLIFATAYTFYRSRASVDDELFYRSLAYVPVGLMAWVHAAEALVLFLPLVLVDVATAESNDRRSLGVVALVFLLSLVPFFLTNFAISGNPLQAPRMLTPYDKASGGTPIQAGGGTGGFLGSGPIGQALRVPSVFGSLLVNGAIVAVTEPTRLFGTLVRSGYQPAVAAKGSAQAINLTVLESAPILGACVGIPLLIAQRLKRNGVVTARQYLGTPAGAVDTFVAGCGLLVFILYIPRIPLHAQATVRYLHPLYPLGIYALARLPPLRRAATNRWQAGGWAYLGTVLLGGQLLLAIVVGLDLGFGETIQLHALIALATATPLAIWILAGVLSDGIADTFGTATMGVAIGATTVFVLLGLLAYFDYAHVYAVPALRLVVERLPLL